MVQCSPAQTIIIISNYSTYLLDYVLCITSINCVPILTDACSYGDRYYVCVTRLKFDIWLTGAGTTPKIPKSCIIIPTDLLHADSSFMHA